MIFRLLAVLGLLVTTPAHASWTATPAHMSATQGADCQRDAGQPHGNNAPCAQCAVPCPVPSMESARLASESPAYPETAGHQRGILPELPTPPPK